MVGKLDRGKAFAAMGADHAMDRSEARHPGMHKTSTVDYALVLDGEIWALMDEGETLLKAGTAWFSAGPTTRGAIAPIGPAAWHSSWSARSRAVR